MVDLLDERSREQGERLARLARPEKASTPAVTPDMLEAALAEQREMLLGEMLLMMPSAPAAAAEKAQPQPAASSSARAEKPAAKSQPQPAKTQAPAGPWMVHLASYDSRAKARRARKRLAGKVPHLEVQRASFKGKPIYRLTATGLENRKAAMALRQRARRELGFKGAWVARR